MIHCKNCEYWKKVSNTKGYCSKLKEILIFNIDDPFAVVEKIDTPANFGCSEGKVSQEIYQDLGD